MIASSVAVKRTRIPNAKLNAAAINAIPTKYTQNNRTGIYTGTAPIITLPSTSCSAPNAANGASNHPRPPATSLPSPTAVCTSLLAATNPTTRITTPATQIQILVLGGTDTS